MVDCGGDSGDMAADEAIKLLYSQGVFHLDGLIITHYDADHAAGALQLMSRVKVDTLFGGSLGTGQLGGSDHFRIGDEVAAGEGSKYAAGADTVLMLCTGDFPHPEQAGGLFLLPEDLLYGILSGLKQKKLGFIVPEPDQIPFSHKQYEALNPVIRASSPYGSMEDLAKTAAAFRDEDVEVIVTDCMGFTADMGRIVARQSGKQVLVPRLVLPKLIKALLVQQ